MPREISVVEAADRLGLSAARVRALITSGAVPARRVGRMWMIDDAALRYLPAAREVGRRLSPRSAWAALAVADAQDLPDWLVLSRAELRRAKERSARVADLAVAGELVNRAELHRFVAHDSVRRRLRTRAGELTLGGSSAADAHRADLIALDLIEGYLPADELDRFVSEYGLAPAVGSGGDVWIRAPRPHWPFPHGVEVAPRAVVAVDLIESGDERSVYAGIALLGQRGHGPRTSRARR